MSNSNVETVNVRDKFEVVETPNHPKAKKLLEFWRARDANGIVIGRDIPSRPVADILSNISINEPIEGGSDCLVRLSGNAVDFRFGRSTTGKRLSEMFPPDEFQRHMATVHAVIESGKPIIVGSRMTDGLIERLHMEVVHLPVLAPDRVTKWALVGIFYFD